MVGAGLLCSALDRCHACDTVVRVVLAEDSYLVREGIIRVLESDPSLELVGIAGDFDGLLAVVDQYQPDVLLTDIRMPPDFADEGIRAAAILCDRHPSVGVVVLSQHDEPEYALKLLERGSARRAYLLKDRLAEPSALLGAIHEVARGGSVIDPTVVERLVATQIRFRSSPLASLSVREREVLSLMAQGCTNEAIAQRLFLSIGVVEKHSNAIFSKLQLSEERDVNRRVKAVLIHLAQGETAR
jgi:DNA-binding NarL/FixJ family response regulator